MKAYLMHGDKPCAIIDPEFHLILSVLDKNELPVGVYNDNDMIQGTLYRNWLKSRAIPKGRPGLSNILSKIDKSMADSFLDFHGVSLTDTYWVKEKDSPLTWKDVNFHENGFYPLFGNVYAGLKDLEWSPTPDFVTDGVMEKFWMSVGGVPCLAKMDQKWQNVQAANEVVVSKVTQALALKTRAVEYEYGKMGEIPVCICPCFVTNERTDFVNALQVSHSGLSGRGEAFFRQAYQEELDDMLFIDVLFGNVDRHDKNYGILKTEQGESFAPIFDSGSCLGFNMTDPEDLKWIRLKYPSNDLSRQEAARLLKKDRNLPNEELLFSILKTEYEKFSVPEFHYDMARNVLTTGMEIIKDSQKTFQIPGMDFFDRDFH